MVRARCSLREQGARLPVFGPYGESKVLTPGARCPVTGLRTFMVRARCSPREQGARLPVFGPYGESKVLTPGARCPVTGLRTLWCSPREQGARLPVFGPYGESKVLTPGARCPVTGLRTLCRCGLRRWTSRNLDNRDGQTAPLRDGGERGWTGVRHFLRKDGQNLWQFLSNWSPGDGGQNGFSGLSASADVTGEQSGVGEDLLSQVRTLQDSAPGLLGCLELAFELPDPLVPLSEGLLEGRHLSTVYLVPVFGPGKEIGDRAIRSPTNSVDHPLVFSGAGAAAQILERRAAGGSSPCFINTSITGVVDPDPSRRGRFAGATSSASPPFSFSFPCLVARVSPCPPLGSEVCVAVMGSPVGTRASVLGASVLRSADLAGPAFLDPKLIFFAGAGGRAETGKLLITPENQKVEKKSFDWDDAKTTLVYNVWEMKAKIRYADYISRLRKNPRPVYIPPEIWTKWNEVWNSEEGKKKTELAKKNRRGGVLNGVAQSTHTTGSTPHVKVAAQLELGSKWMIINYIMMWLVDMTRKEGFMDLVHMVVLLLTVHLVITLPGNMTPTSRPPDNAASASVQDEIQSLKATILLMQQRLDAIDGGRVGTSSSPPSQTD
nr:uncharacterized protein LOC109173928 [Ipomoea trifida]